MSDDTNKTENNANPAERERSLWQQLRDLFSSDRDTSLRESLEGVIEQHGQDNGGNGIKPEARSMMLNIIEFADTRVDDIMVPRADIIAIEQNTTISDVLAQFINANHSRLPVYNDVLDDPIGMVHIKDLLSWLSARNKHISKTTKAKNSSAGNGWNITAAILNTPVIQTDVIRSVLFVPPSMPAGDLLVKMQSTRTHMAVVVDEYGGTDGLVTIEDAVEEIVGEIADEHDDDEETHLKKISPTSYMADARANIEDVEEALQIELLPKEYEEDVDTLGGLIFTMLDRVPARGELVKHQNGIEFQILEADPRRVRKMKIRLTNAPNTDKSDSDS